VAVASAGPYASLLVASDRLPHELPTTLFFYRRVRFLPPDQQRQSTEDMQVVLEKGSLNVSLVLTVILAVVVGPG